MKILFNRVDNPHIAGPKRGPEKFVNKCRASVSYNYLEKT